MIKFVQRVMGLRLPDNHIVTNNKDREECIYSIRKSAGLGCVHSFLAFPYLSHIKKKEIFNHEKRTDYSS